MKAVVVKSIDRAVVSVPDTINAPVVQPISAAQLDRERRMFGCTAAAIDEALAGKSPRDIALYAMGTLANAQELIQRTACEEGIEWVVADRDANTIRQFLNVAKYAINKTVPR